MKQILQNLGSGETVLADVPCPRKPAGNLLIETSATLVSMGTEKMLLDFGKANLLDKARQQPDKVKQVLQKVRTDGLRTTVEAVRAKLDQPIPLGYSNVGRVLEPAAGDVTLKAGDRVVSNGNHAEVVSVPRNLCAAVPDGVSDEAASFTVVAAIGLQGIRLLQPTLGERVVVTGLGLIGLLCVQMLRAHGCRVLGIDFDEEKLALARGYGAETVSLAKGEDPVAVAEAWSGGVGVDGVLITAATKSNEPMQQAATMCRKRGRVVLVGVVGLQLNRADFYEKELSFQVSCSYGPGRYDPAYEKLGLDYPVGFVRWTEQRNFEAVLQLMAEGRLDVSSLVTHRYGFDDALKAYETVSEGGALGIVLEYAGGDEKRERTVAASAPSGVGASGEPSLAFIGAGGFTTRMLLPTLKGQAARLKTIVSGTGVTGTHAAKKFGFESSSTDSDAVMADGEVNTVFITTPHNSHAALVKKALEAGKRVFVEKPLCMNRAELDELEPLVSGGRSLVMVGFNRRFSPHTRKIKSLLEGVRAPKSFVMTVNAGAIPADHWTQDPAVGGGRVIGEACHFIDLLRFLAGAAITHASADYLGGEEGKLGDTVNLNLRFADGSVGTVHYFANGHKDFPKERLEVFAAGRMLCCDNFRRTTGSGWKGFKKFSTPGQDKGHKEEVKRFLDAVRRGEPSPIPAEELIEVTRWTLDLAERQS